MLVRIRSLVLTLFLASVLVFTIGEILPGGVGRLTLGPLADPRAVSSLDHQLGNDRPIPVRYWAWLGGLFANGMGTSLRFNAPVAPLIGTALLKSLVLGGLAGMMAVPLGVAAGVWAASRRGGRLAFALNWAGFAASAVPAFLVGAMLIGLFGHGLADAPSTEPSPAPGFAARVAHLFLTAMPLALMLFGVFARLTLAQTRAVLGRQYTRTAVLKGLPWSVVVRRHVLPNTLLPIPAFAASNMASAFGSLVVIETMFRFGGVGELTFASARGHDLPTLEAALMTMACVVILSRAAADLAGSARHQRLRSGASP